MGRFSSWAQSRAAESPKEEAAAEAVQEKQLFIVENLQLRSKSNGIRYRCSPDLADKHSKVALFGSRIKGIPYGGCWIQVGSRFLPTHIGGAEVLRPVEDGSAEGIAVEPVDEDVKDQDKLLGQMLFGRSEVDAGYIDQRQLDKSPTRLARTLIRPETSMTDAPILSVGDGAVYEVLYDRVAIRSAASTTSTTLEIKQKGETVELFEWDPSRKWRRCAADALATTAGWVLLDHPEFGPLVRPKGAPLCARPLEPLCAAASEAQLGELRRFLNEGLDPRVCDAGGISALTLAAQSDARDCAIHLIEAGAVTTAAAGDAAIRNASSAGTRVLIQALLGHIVEDDAALQDALGDLTLEARLAADRILEQLSEAAEAEALRRVGSGPGDAERTQPAAGEATAVESEGQPKLPRRKGGKLHEVLHKAVAVRYLPSTTADMVGTRILGQLVELFEESAWQMESGGKWKMQKVVKRSGTSDNPSDSLQAFSDMLWQGLDASAAPTACNSAGLLACVQHVQPLRLEQRAVLANSVCDAHGFKRELRVAPHGYACSRWSGIAKLRMDAAKLHRLVSVMPHSRLLFCILHVFVSTARGNVLVASKSGGTVETRNALVETKAFFLSHGVDFASKSLAITCAGSRLDRNPAVLLARAWQSLAGRAMVVLPYRDRLQLFGRYLQQLVMESLGKAPVPSKVSYTANCENCEARNLQGDMVNHGLTVYGNKGSTDQHAILQQLLDGPDDFFAVFIAAIEGVHDNDSKEVETGITSSDYLLAFLLGTRRALTAAGRRSLTITLQRVDAFHLGVLIALFERAVGLYAALIGVNAYNQPAVELGKQAASDVLTLLRMLRDNDTLPAKDADQDDVEILREHLAFQQDVWEKMLGLLLRAVEDERLE
ncbi:pgi [Symbiodinium sp. CCMP2592]|nr:pgi [Symbiodinium sp. CCMP2592]